MTTDIHLNNWIREIGDKNKIGLAIFGTKWNGSSNMMRSILTSLIKENEDQLALISFDLDESPNLAAEYQICELPTIMFFLNGKVEIRIDGLIPKHELASQINTLLH